MPPRGILVITGASGSGKTAVVEALAAAPIPGTSYQHFDSLGVPTAAVMTAQYGSPEQWQVARTHEWITRLATQAGSPALAVLEGQVRPSVVAEAFRANRVRFGRILLIDCSPEVRAFRLRQSRGQPQLASSQMMAWAAYLRGQADALQIPTLDTTHLTLHEASARVREHVTGLAAITARGDSITEWP